MSLRGFGVTEKETMGDDIRRILDENARLSVDIRTISDHDDLFAAGMTSHATVNVLLAIEEKYGIEFPTEMLRRSTFATITAICEATVLLTSATVTPYPVHGGSFDRLA